MSCPHESTIPKVKTLEGIEKVSMKPEEAFVLSRVDGQTDLAQIAKILGMEVEKVWGYLERLHEGGFIELEVPAGAGSEKKKKSQSILDQVYDEDSDPVLGKIPREKRREILQRHKALAKQTHYEIIGVIKEAPENIIRKKYLRLVKQFHPDRFFGKDLKHYEKPLNELFEAITQAFDTLTNEKDRAVYDEELRLRREEKKPRKEERAMVDERGEVSFSKSKQAGAKRYFEMGEAEEMKENWVAAANFFQMAHHIDRGNARYIAALKRAKDYAALEKRKKKEANAEKEKDKEFLKSVYVAQKNRGKKKS